VDFSGFYCNFSIYRRNGIKESSAETLLRVSRCLPSRSLVIRFIFWVPQELRRTGIGREVRPLLLSDVSSIISLQGSLTSQLHQDNDSSSLFGQIRRGDSSTPFVANAFQSQGRKLYTLSSAFSDMRQSVDIEAFIDDDNEEQQQIPVHSSENRPEIRVKYSMYMDFNDCANAATLDAMCGTRKHHWSSAVGMWMLPMMACVNGKKCYQSATGKTFSNQQWRLMVREALPCWNKPCNLSKREKWASIPLPILLGFM